MVLQILMTFYHVEAVCPRALAPHKLQRGEEIKLHIFLAS
jgi:hypothetical protein